MRNYCKPVSLIIGVLITVSLLVGFFVTSSVVSASTADYSCNKITVTRGQIASGSAASLNLKDSSYLAINSVNSSGYYYVDWIAEFTLASQPVSGLSLSYTGKYSNYRGQYLYLYNYSTSTWQKIDYRTIGPAIVNINLSSIASPASFVSPTGLVQVRVYSFSTASYSGYTDLLKISAAHNVAATEPAPTTPTPTPAPTPALTTANLRSGDYTSTDLEVTRGTLASGGAASLNLKDSSCLAINSVNNSGYYYVDWISEFTLPSRQVSSLSLSYSGKYSNYRGQYVYLYNYSTPGWQKIDYRSIGPAIVNINLASIASPASFVSPTGQVQVRVYSFSSAAYSGNTDLLKLCVTY